MDRELTQGEGSHRQHEEIGTHRINHSGGTPSEPPIRPSPWSAVKPDVLLELPNAENVDSVIVPNGPVASNSRKQHRCC